MSESLKSPKLQVGGTLNPHKHLYISRTQEEAQLFQLLNEREYCNVIASRQVGKSSMVTFIIDKLEAAGNSVAYCDISGEIGEPTNSEDWYIGYLGMLSLEFGLEIEVSEWWQKQSGATPNQRLLRFFEEVLLKEIKSPLVIIMDEIDFSLNLPYTDDFFVAIRTMYNSRNRHPSFERLTFCLVGVATPNELIKKQRTTPYNIGKTLHLADFPWEPENLRPLIDYLSTETIDGEALLERIFYWTAGHPFLTTWMCDEARGKQLSSPEQIDALIKALFDNITKVSNDPHFERVITFLDNRINDKLDAYTTYEQLLAGKKIPARATATHIKLKLAGLVKSSPDGYLAVRNRIYERIFNLDWVRQSKPRLTVRNLKRFAVAASLIIFLLVSYFFYNMMIVEPPKRMAATLEEQINQTEDPEKAKELYQYLAGEKAYPDMQHNPLLGTHLSGFQERAQLAMDEFWKRIEAATEALFAALENTSKEADAKRLFGILSGKTADPNTGKVFKGHKEKALLAYKDFWERRAASLETRALQRLEDGDVDRALLLGAAAAIKRDGELHPNLLKAYRKRGYERLYRTIRSSFGGWDRIDFSLHSNSIAVTNSKGIYEIETGKNIKKLGTGTGLSLRFSRDGKYVASGDFDQVVRVWGLLTRGKPVELSGLEYPLDIDFSNDSQQIAAISLDGNLAMVWNLNTREVLHEIKLPGNGLSIRFSPNGTKLAAGHDDGVILIEAISGKKIYDIATENLTMGLDFSPDGKRLAMATWNSTGAFIWNVGKNSQQLHLPFDANLYGIAFSPNGRYVFAGGNITDENITARLWDAKSGRVLYEVKGHTEDLRDISYSSNGKWVATVSSDDTARIWDVNNLQTPEAPSPTESTPQELWQRFQLMLNYTIDDNDEVIPLWPTGPRELDGWNEDNL